MSAAWSFFQTQILGMAWLNGLFGRLLEALGVDVGSRLGGAVQFFLYDSVKILILLTLLIFGISYIQSYFPPERARVILGRFGGLWGHVLAALLGTVTPFCSCSSIPLFMGFTGAGIPLGVTFSFLISSPMVDLASLVLLMSVFGWRVAVLYVLLGLAAAVAGGWFIGRMDLEDQLEEVVRLKVPMASAELSLTAGDRARFAADQVKSTVKKVFPYVLLGVALGAVIHNWIPQRFVVGLLGRDNPFGVILAVVAGVPMYADIFGTVPIARALLAKGALLGVVLAFMMAVTTLSLPSLVLLRRAVRPRLLAVFTGVCMAGILIVGYLFNFLQPFLV